MIDFAQAFRDGAREAQPEYLARTDVENALEQFCGAIETASATPPVISIGRVTLGALGGNLREDAEPVTSKESPYRDGGGWTRILMFRAGGKMARANGVDLLAYKRADDGYPVSIRWVDGRIIDCASRDDLDNALASELRLQATNTRIRNVARDFAGMAPRR